MAKQKTVYICNECGGTSLRWVGKCPDCNEWNTMVEQVQESKKSSAPRGISSNNEIKPLYNITYDEKSRIYTQIQELDRVLGGGIVVGGLTLIGGDPGVGKSTLLLQAAGNLAKSYDEVLYVSGEESMNQVAIRAARLGVKESSLKIYCETDVNKILNKAKQLNAKFMIIDSIQTMYREDISSAPGSVSQVRESAGAYMRYAKESGCAIFLVGHVTKSGSIAGPRVLEHMVDTVLYFEGGTYHAYRILRAVKNRYGSTNEIGVFEMSDSGMNEVKNPSEVLMAQRSEGFPGSVVTVTMEGTRPLLVEMQALVSQTAFGTPRRQASGFDYNRMVLLLAVLEKRGSLVMYNQDVYVNIAGGLKVVEPSADLSLVVAVASAIKDKVVSSEIALFGEVGLTGEIRSVSYPQQRVNEAARSGFKQIILPTKNIKGITAPKGVSLIPVERLAQALGLIFI